jgi:S1-C subfamily serine protease
MALLSNIRFPLALIAALACLFTAVSSRADEDEANAFAAAIDYAQKRTVKLYGAGIGREPGYASGILVSADGQILTAQGIYLSGERLRITLPDGSSHQATLVRRSQNLQLALLKIEAQTPDFFNLPEQAPVKQGDWVLAVSNAFKVADGDEPLSVNLGIVSLRTRLEAKRGFSDIPYDADVLLIDAITSNPGAPGGAVMTADSRLAGLIGRIIEGKTTNTRLNYVVPTDLLAQFLAGKEPAPVVAASGAKGELGIRLFGLGGRKGPAFIDRVVAGSPAAKAGLKADDLVVSLAGQVVHDSLDYKKIVESLRAGQEITVVVKRNNQLVTVQIVPVAVEE